MDFDEFWQVYPRKVAKNAARRAYWRALKSVDHGVILFAAMRYAQERKDQDPTYTKHPATWLNGGCWDDEAAPKRERAGVIGALDRLDAYLSETEDRAGSTDDLFRLPSR